MQDLYPNLAGQLTEFKDGGLQLRSDPNPPTTGSVVLLGTAVDGPILEPVAVDPATAEAIFGRSVTPSGIPNGATLMQGFEEAWSAGCRDIRVMRITGKQSTAVVRGVAASQEATLVNSEVIGVAPGNTQATFQVANNNVVSSSVKVFANGTQLGATAFTVASRDVTVKAETCDTNASILINYQYTTSEEVALEDEPAVCINQGTNTQYRAVAQYTNWVNTQTVVVKVDGVAANGGTYSVDYDTGVVTFNAGTTGTVTLSFTYTKTTTFTASENGKLVSTTFTAWRAPGGPKLFSLNVPAGTLDAASVKLYANGIEVPTAGVVVNGPAKTLTLQSGYVPMGAILEANYAYVNTSVVAPVINLTSVFGGLVYNGIKFRVDQDLNGETKIGMILKISKPDAKKASAADAPLSYRSIDYPTFGLLCAAINADYDNNVVKASTLYPDAKTEDLEAASDTAFFGGEDGVNLTKEQLYSALGGERDADGLVTTPGAYQMLENYNVDQIVPLGVYADDALVGKYDNFAYQLGLACAVISHRNNTTTGVIAMRSPDEATLVAVNTHVNTMLTKKNDFFMMDRFGNTIRDNDGNTIDLGRFLTVVAGPDLIFNGSRLGRYATNSAACYAGFVSTLPIKSAPTNKSVPGAIGMRYKFSNQQLNKLTGARFVTYKVKADGTIGILDGMTAAQPGSDFVRQSSMRIVKAAVNEVRNACEPYLGEPNETSQRNALAATIAKRLDKMKEAGDIVDYAFQIIASLRDQVLGQAKIELTIVPPFEMRQLTTVVGLRPTL